MAIKIGILGYGNLGKGVEAAIKKNIYDDIGLNFENYLMDKERSCANKCIFCFIDQLPPGMRDTLYFNVKIFCFVFRCFLYTVNAVTDKEIKFHSASPIN